MAFDLEKAICFAGISHLRNDPLSVLWRLWIGVSAQIDDGQLNIVFRHVGCSSEWKIIQWRRRVIVISRWECTRVTALVPLSEPTRESVEGSVQVYSLMTQQQVIQWMLEYGLLVGLVVY